MADTIASVVVQSAADMGDAIAGLRDAAAAFLGLGRAMEDTAQAGYVFGRAAQAVLDEQKRLETRSPPSQGCCRCSWRSSCWCRRR